MHPLPPRRACPWPAALAALFLGACSGDRATPPSRSFAAERDEFSVMTYNVLAYGFDDRDGDGQRNDPKPREEREAVVALVARARPDVLALQEIGAPVAFEEFRYALRQAGLEYEHVEYLERGAAEKYVAVLSRFPLVARRSHTDDAYTIGEANVPVARGFIDVDIQVSPAYRFRLMVAHLKSKVFHPLGQTEMRRNEARLLGKHARNALKDNADVNLLVVGDMNDTWPSAALREIVGKGEPVLVDLRPCDYVGDAWTHFTAADDGYNRLDYMLASPGMLAEVVRAKTRVVRDPLTSAASDHRPLVAVFKTTDLPASAAPPQPARPPPAAESE